MISYNNVWSLMKERNVSTYRLIKCGISPATIQRLREGKHIDTLTINRLCNILQCQPGDFLAYVPDQEPEQENIGPI